MAGPFKYTIEFNWQNQGFTEVYYSNDTDLATARGRSPGLAKARAAIMPKDPTFYIWGIRVSDVANPGQNDFTRFSLGGTYSPSIQQTAASPWDAWLYEAQTAAGFHKVQEIRGIPTTLTGIVGNVPIPDDPWLHAFNTFRTYLANHNFGIYHAVVPNQAAQIPVVSIVPNVNTANVPVGALVVTTSAGHGIPANFQATVIFRQVRCVPKLASRHVGVYINGTSFYLKNTDVGQIAYSGGGKMFLFSGTVVSSTNRIDLRSATRKVGRAFGTQKGKRLSRV